MVMTKPYTSFRNKLLHFDDDIEMADILYSTVKATTISENATTLFEYQDNKKHPNLSRYKICPQNRVEIVRHLKSSISSSYMKDLYEEFTIYLRSIIAEAYQNASVSPERLIGEHKVTMSAVEILSEMRAGTLSQTIVDLMFQALENERSTISLIEKTCKKIGISIPKDIITDAVYYLEIRHKLVHTDGYADAEFRKTHPTLQYTKKHYIDLTYSTLVSAKTAIFNLVQQIDKEVLTKGLVEANTPTKK